MPGPEPQTVRTRAAVQLVSRWATFNIVGAFGIAIQLIMFTCLVRVLGWPYLWATAAAVEAAVLHNFLGHQRWTWTDRPATSWRMLANRFARFQVLNGGISLAGNLALMRLLTGVLGVDPVAANIAAIISCGCVNFAASEFVVFRSPLPAVLAVLLALLPVPVAAQGPSAQAAWEQHQACVDARYNSAASPGPAFFIHDVERRSGWRDTVHAGGISVAQIGTPTVSDGRLHHWVGALFVPAITVDALISRLESNAGRESESYTDVVASKLLGRDGDRVRVFLKLRRTSVITVTYNTEHVVEYRRIDPRRGSARSVATKISELADPGTAREREKAAGDDNGFLWHLNAYWRYEASGGGVIIECESVSLSRSVPMLLRPIAGPIVDRIARESLESTLRGLRAMLAAAPRQSR